MNKNKKIVFGLDALALVLVSLGITGLSAEAYKGKMGVRGPNFSEERHVNMAKDFETKDYEAWKNLMQEKGRVVGIMTKDNFKKFAEAYNLAKSGDIEGAKKIRQDLDLGLEDGRGVQYKNRCSY